MLQSSGVESVVRSWIKNDDGPACNLARKIIRQWESSRFAGTNLNRKSTTPARSNGHANGRTSSQRIAALKSPSLSPSSESGNETETVTDNKLTSSFINQSLASVASLNASTSSVKNAKRNRSMSISSSSSEDETQEKVPSVEIPTPPKSAVPAMNSTEIVSSEEAAVQLTTHTETEISNDSVDVVNIFCTAPTLSYHNAENQQNDSEVNLENNETSANLNESLQPPPLLSASKSETRNPEDGKERYSPGNPSFVEPIDSDSSEEGQQLNIAEISASSLTAQNNILDEKSPPRAVESVIIADSNSKAPMLSSLKFSPPSPKISPPVVVKSEIDRTSHKEKLLDLKRRAALICNIPELASTSPKKKKKKDKKHKEKKSKKKSLKKSSKSSKRDNSTERHKQRRSSSNLEYDSLSGDESANSND